VVCKRYLSTIFKRTLLKDVDYVMALEVETVSCRTTKGEIIVEVHRDWAKHGAERFLHLVQRGYFEGIGFFRKNHWIIQFGAVQHPQTGKRKKFSGMKTIPDDPPTDCGGECTKNRLWDGALAFAGGGKDSRSDQVFFVHHLGHQPIGGELWETPIGNVTHGMDVLKNIYGGYGESVNQVKIFQRGDDYLKEFPLLDYMLECNIIQKDLWSNLFLRGNSYGSTGTYDDYSPIFTMLPQVFIYVGCICTCLVSLCVYAVRKRNGLRKSQ